MSDDEIEVPAEPQDLRWKPYDDLAKRIALYAGAVAAVGAALAVVYPAFAYMFQCLEIAYALFVIYWAIKLRRILDKQPSELSNPTVLDAAMIGVWGAVVAISVSLIGLLLKTLWKIGDAIAGLQHDVAELVRMIDRISSHLTNDRPLLEPISDFVPDTIASG